MRSLLPQKRHGLNAVGRHTANGWICWLAESFLRQPDIARAVFDEEKKILLKNKK